MKWTQRAACRRRDPLQWLCFVLILALPFTGRAQSMEADFAWLDTLGFPDAEGLAFKRVESKEANRSIRVKKDGKLVTEQVPTVYYGFHLKEKEDAKTLWLLSADLRPTPLSKEDIKPLEDYSLEAYAKSLLEEKDPKNFWQRRGGVSWQVNFPNRSHACIVAWLARKHGLEDVARSLYERSRELPNRENRFLLIPGQKEKAELSFRESLEEEIGSVLMNLTIDSFGSPFLPRGSQPASRPELLKAFERHQRCFSNSPEAEFVARAIEILNQMIAEDADHVELSAEDLDRLPVEQQVDEWLYRLREDRGHLSGDGDCYVRCEELVNLGYAAVPRLIEALDDDRFTRGVRNGLWATPAEHTGRKVVRVGDVAANALMDITKERFSDLRQIYLGDTSPKAVEARKQVAGKAREWWKTFQETGEEEMLVAGVRKGGREAAARADLLLRRFPDRAEAAIIEGLEATKSDKYARRDLLESLGDLRGEKSDAYFLREANTEPDLSCRTYSARTLFQRGKRREAVASMIQMWRNREQWLRQNEIDLGNTLPDLIEILVTCNDPAVIVEIERDFSGLEVYLRYGIVEKLSRYRGLMGAGGGTPPKGYSQEFREAVHSLLARAARDDDMRWNLPLMGSPDRRVADPAVKALARWRPETFPRQLDETFRQRELARFKTLVTLSEAENVPPPVRPAWLEPTKFESVNHVTGIERRGLLAEKAPGWVEPLSNLEGEDLDIDVLCKIFNGFVSDKNFADKTLVISAIRHENRTGVCLIADLYPNIRPLIKKSILQTRNSMGSWHSYEQLIHWEEHHAETAEVLKQMLADTAKNELRLRLVLMKR